jgi:transposase
MDSFDPARPAGDALNACRRLVLHDTRGRHGEAGAPLYTSCLTLHADANLLDDKQTQRLQDLFAPEMYVEVDAIWAVYQLVIAAYREPDQARGPQVMQRLIGSIRHSVPAAMSEVITRGQASANRASDVPAHIDGPGTSNAPTKSIDGWLEHLRGVAIRLGT